MSLFSENYLNSIVLIGEERGENFYPLATGFLAGFLSGEKNEDGKDLFWVFLITNRHVFRNKNSVWLRFNKVEGGSKKYELNLLNETGNEIWSTHPNPNVDVAVIMLNAKKLGEDKVMFNWIPEDLFAFRKQIKELKITQGDEIFVLGFPMGIAGEEKNYAILRGGIIARLDDEIIDKTNSFLIDAFVFPGNSGGPVILKPSMISIQGTTPVNKAYLLGVVNGYLPYEESAFSLRDLSKPRINFTENSGLASVVPLDYVKEIIDLLLPKEEDIDKKEEEKMVIEDDKKLSSVEK